MEQQPTPLHQVWFQAVLEGDVDLLSVLVNRIEDPNIRGYPPPQSPFCEDLLRIMQSSRRTYPYGVCEPLTALEYAAILRNAAIVELLVEQCGATDFSALEEEDLDFALRCIEEAQEHDPAPAAAGGDAAMGDAAAAAAAGGGGGGGGAAAAAAAAVEEDEEVNVDAAALRVGDQVRYRLWECRVIQKQAMEHDILFDLERVVERNVPLEALSGHSEGGGGGSGGGGGEVAANALALYTKHIGDEYVDFLVFVTKVNRESNSAFVRVRHHAVPSRKLGETVMAD